MASGGETDQEPKKAKPFRCGDCEQDFSAICLLHTHLRGGSYHYDEDTMTAIPLGGTTCNSVFKRLKAEKTEKKLKPTPLFSSGKKPDLKRKIFKIKKIKKLKNKTGDDTDPGFIEKAFNIAPSSKTGEGDGQGEYKEIELGEPGSPSKKNKRQLVINLYGMDRNEDGSLRLVVGEKDSAVFKTPAGDAILKALKDKGEMFKGHMKVIYNYPDSTPAPDDEGDDGDDDFDEEEDEDDDEDVGDEPSETGRIHFTRSSSKKGPSKAKKRKRDSITIEPLSPGGLESAAEASSPEKTPTKVNEPVVFKMLEERISTVEATAILNAVLSGHHLAKVARGQIPRPKGGEVYLIDLDALPKTKERKMDFYKWNNCGSKKYPKGKEVIMKTYYKVKLPNGYFSDVFVKHFFQMVENPRICLIHYMGDPPLL